MSDCVSFLCACVGLYLAFVLLMANLAPFRWTPTSSNFKMERLNRKAKRCWHTVGVFGVSNERKVMLGAIDQDKCCRHVANETHS